MVPFCASPVLKWAGGKQAIAGQIIRYFPTAFSRYYEPFVGGGSVLFTLAPRNAIIGDLNGWLLDTYEAIRSDYRKVARLLDELVNTRKEYHRIRAIR